MSEQIFLACNGSWQIGATGSPVCSGLLTTYTGKEMATLIMSESSLTYEEWKPLIAQSIELFAVVFGFLILRKLLT